MNDASMFDADSLLQTQVEGSLDTSRKPIREMEEAQMVIKSVGLKLTGKNSEYTVLDLVFIVDEQDARDDTGMTEPQIKHGVFLDIDDSGMIDMAEGKNIDLGRLRAACGQNDGGAWSPMDLEGQPVVGHIIQQPDKNDPTIIYNRIKAFASDE